MMDLKPCPFCGGAAEIKSSRQPTNGGKSFMRGWVGCTRCSVYMQWNHDPAGTVKKWNRREGVGGCIRGLEPEAASCFDELSKRPPVEKLTDAGLLLLECMPEAINALAERLTSKLDDLVLHEMKGDA